MERKIARLWWLESALQEVLLHDRSVGKVGRRVEGSEANGEIYKDRRGASKRAC